MKRYLFFILSFVFSVFCYSQKTASPLVNKLHLIKEQQGDSIARVYLESQKDSLEQKGELSSYILLWGLLTSNMWNEKPTESLKKEYKEYLDAIIDDEIKADNYVPSFDLLSPLWQLTHDYYNMIYSDGDKEAALSLLLNIHRWFEPYEDARNSIGYAQSLLDLCVVLVRDMHKYGEGEPFIKEYAEVSRNVYGEKSAQHAIALYNITVLPQIQSEEKIKLLEKAISIYEKAGVPDEAMFQQMKQGYNLLTALTTGVPNNAIITNEDTLSLEDCSSLVLSGRGKIALKYLKKYKDELQKEEYLDKLKYASIITLLINSFMQVGDYSSAQKEIDSFNDYIGINIKQLPADYLQIFYSCAGQVAFRLKDYSKALRYSHAACNLFEKTGDYGIEYSKNLANIAMIYAEAGEYLDANFYLDAKWYIDEAISVFEERIGPLKEHGNIGITLLSNAAIVYDAIGDRDDAISTLQDIVKDFANNTEVSDAWSLAVNNLATMYMKQDRWSEAEKLLDNLYGNNDERNYLFAQNLALCRLYLKDNKKTIKAVEDMNRYSTNNIANIFSYFAGIEREKYWTYISKELIMNNNLVAYHTNDGQAVSLAYNNALFCKNLLVNSSMIMDKYYADSADQNIKNTYLHYKELKERLAYKSMNQSDRDSLSREITKLEKSMINNIGNLGQLLKNETRTWKDIQHFLEKDEIAIEYCYAPRMERYPDLQPYYGAFVLRKDYEYPILVSLENVDVVEEVFDNDNPDEIFVNELYSHDKAVTLYNMLWNKMSPYLQDVKTVYYSPTGHLSELNFEVLHGEDGLMLNERYSMYRISSTANIANLKSSVSDYKTSVLYGNVKYDETAADMEMASSSYDTYSGTEIQSGLALRSENERGKWGPIPSTKEEVRGIKSLLTKKGVQVSVFEENNANEESFKSLSGNSPEILHMATHGFVIDTSQHVEGNKFVSSTNVYSQKDSYMMWAGLILAGGNNIWQGNFDLLNVEDGILTADEISRLDLSNTKLVVLSACETARGKVDPVDGVYGLQRAFKMAGAQTIVMSLWKVQDDATSMLMTQFYTHLTNGIEKHKALWNAMMDVKEKYKDPYFWAGFVMLD